MMIGESEKVAKKAVEEHKMSGSLLFRSPTALFEASRMHLTLLAAIFCPIPAGSHNRRAGGLF